MPRGKREYSKTGRYHVTSRGVRRSIIFEDDDDRILFLSLIEDAINKFEHYKVKLYAYVLMDNHFHLLIEAQDKGISLVLKSIKERYAEYYNKKYETNGPLFDGRFGSKAVDDDDYFIETMKYIFNNPVRAEICDNPADYQWSSYSSMFNIPGKNKQAYTYGYNKRIISTEYVKSLYSDIRHLEEYINDGVAMNRSDFEKRRSHNTPTETIKAIIARVASKMGLEGLKELEREERDPFLKAVKKTGIEITIISRMTGYPIKIVRDA